VEGVDIAGSRLYIRPQRSSGGFVSCVARNRARLRDGEGGGREEWWWGVVSRGEGERNGKHLPSNQDTCLAKGLEADLRGGARGGIWGANQETLTPRTADGLLRLGSLA
jgi:hypothetical protein